MKDINMALSNDIEGDFNIYKIVVSDDKMSISSLSTILYSMV